MVAMRINSVLKCFIEKKNNKNNTSIINQLNKLHRKLSELLIVSVKKYKLLSSRKCRALKKNLMFCLKIFICSFLLKF